MSSKFKPFTFPIESVAEAFFEDAMNATYDENEDFYWARYGGLDFEFSDAVGEQNGGLWKNPNSYEGFFISSAIGTAFIESMLIFLSNECITPYAGYVVEDILRLAAKKIMGWDILHARARAYLASKRNEIEHNTGWAFDRIAEWLIVEEFAKDKSADHFGICQAFSKRFAELKLKCIHDLEELDVKEWLDNE